jgi:hypothetical protein
MTDATDYCWVGADGALHSGSSRELLRAHHQGDLPSEHPVWRQGWPEWMALRDALSESHLADDETRPTERAPLPAWDGETSPTSPLSDRTLADAVRPAATDADATLEDVTQPLWNTAWAPPTLRSEPPPIPLVRSATLPPGGTSRTLPPPVRRRRAMHPAFLGAALASLGALTAAAIVIWSAVETPSAQLRRGFAVNGPLSPSAPVAQPPGPTRCSVGARVSLASRVAPLPTIHTEAVGPGRVAVGVTTGERSGLGVVVGLEPLRVEARSLHGDAVHVAGVLPSAGGSGASFGVDRFTRRVPGPASFSLGMTPGGFTRVGRDGAQSVLWPGQAREVISRPAIAKLGGESVAVAFRRGGDDAGVVRLGWIDARGARASELATLAVASGVVGAPALASNGERVALTYAVRQPASAPWSIELAGVGPRELPNATRRFAGGTPDIDQQRPALAALPNGRWLLAWVEGSRTAGRRVRARVLDAALAPVGATLDLARSDAFVGALAAHGVGSRVLVLFSERGPRAHEALSAVTVDCP